MINKIIGYSIAFVIVLGFISAFGAVALWSLSVLGLYASEIGLVESFASGVLLIIIASMFGVRDYKR